MTCKRCGSRCEGRLCAPCERDERYGGFSAGDEPATDGGAIAYECAACGERYTAEALVPCPACGEGRARAVAEGTAALPRRVRVFVERHPEASVPRVLGRFLLDPAEWAAPVAVALDAEDPTADDGGQATLGGVEA